MDAQKIDRLERLLERALSAEEKDRLRRIKDILGIADNDALWDVLTAMEYQRKYYDELPEKISLAATEIFKGLSQTAEKEVAKVQGRLAERVAEQAKSLSLKIHLHTWLLWGVLALISLLLYGSLLLWAGYSIGSGQTQPPALLLRMPSGFLIGGLCAPCGIFWGVLAARGYASGNSGWKKHMLAALGCVFLAGLLFSFNFY